MMMSSYKALRLGGGRVIVNSSKLGALKQVDAVVFDCDGVLVDTRGSYDATIAKVTRMMVMNLTGVQLPYERVAPMLIFRLRRTGGFNNDWDTTYALTLLSLLAFPASKVQRKIRSGESVSLTPIEKKETLNRFGRIVDEFCSSSRGVGHVRVDSFLERSRLDQSIKAMVDNARGYLGYPGSPPQSLMATVFDEIYHGPKLFLQMYGFPAQHYFGEGMIEDDRLLIDRETLTRLSKLLGGRRLAITTGRPFLAAKYTLGHLMSYFDRNASTYIGDADVNLALAKEFMKYRKPSGASLLRAKDELAAGTMLYVGDSVEDQMMVEDARLTYGGILFAGVFGTVADEEEQVKYFTEHGADLVMGNVKQVPLALEMMKKN